MIKLLKAALLIAAAFTLWACTGQPSTPTTLLQNKDKILENIRSIMPEACSYKGRTNMRFADKYSKGGVSAIVNKTCSGDMDVHVLGPFGIQLAELTVRGDSYKIYQNGKDVTSNPPVRIDPSDLLLMRKYLNLPPPMPDEQYDLMLDIDHYIFILDDENIYVSPDFYVYGVLNKDHTVEYFWDKGDLKSMRFTRQDTILSVEFTDPWKTN